MASRIARIASDIKTLFRVRGVGSPVCDTILLFSIALLLYSAFVSSSFNEGDSYNFAKGLREVDLAAERPHSPGYPVYMFFGRILFSVTHDELTALRWISVISGSLTLIPLYYLTKALYDRKTAFLTCLALMILPGFWLPSEKATTDALATFLLTLGVTMLYFGSKGNSTAGLLSWIVYSFSIGVRPTHLAFVPLWLYGSLKRRDLKLLSFSICAFTVTTLMWVMPVVWVTRWDRFLIATRHVFVGTANTDFVFANPLGLDPLERFVFMVAAIYTFALGGMLPKITSFKFPFATSSIPTFYIAHDILLIGVLVCPILLSKRIVERRFVLLWIVPHFVFVYMFGSPIHHRYFLPIYPALTLLTVSSVVNLGIGGRLKSSRINVGKIVSFTITFLMVVTLLAHTMPLAAKLHTELSPTTQLTRYVKEHYRPDRTTILVFHEYTSFEMYAREFRYYHCRKQILRTLQALKASSNDGHTTLMTSTAYEYLLRHRSVIQLNVSKAEEFYLDPRAEIEDHRLTLYLVRTCRLS